MKIICAKRNEKDRTSCEAFVARSGLVRRFACDFQFFSDQDYMRFAQMILWRFALPKNSHLASPGSFCFPPPLAQASLARVEEKQNPSARLMGFLLPDQDSNLDKQNQNLSYYHYTIGQ